MKIEDIFLVAAISILIFVAIRIEKCPSKLEIARIMDADIKIIEVGCGLVEYTEIIND